MTPRLLDLVFEPRALSPVFQPVFEIGKESRLHGIECLIRGPKGSSLESPDVLFGYFRRRHQEPLIDRACIVVQLAAAARFPTKVSINLNVHASTLRRGRDFVEFLRDQCQELAFDIRRITLEVLEYGATGEARTIVPVLEELRKHGVCVAIDDVGLGLSNFRTILDCRPEFLKLDRYFVKGCESDPFRFAVLETVSDLARRFGSRVVAEGVETTEELARVMAAEIPLVQGYLYARPLPEKELLEFLGNMPKS